MPTHTLRLFGGVSLTGEGGPVAGAAGQRKRLALLALLAATPERSLSRDKLVALLWPDTDPTKARHLLADAVYELRSAIGKDAIRNVGEDLVLDLNLVATDVAEFQRALREGRREDAVEVYRGPFLDGFVLSDAPEFDRWSEEQRTRLDADYARALESLGEESVAADDHRRAVEWWRKLAAHDPFSSRVAVRLIRSLAAAGDPAAAIRHARVHEVLLREELHAPPDPEVTALAQRLQASPTSTVPPVAAAQRSVIEKPAATADVAAPLASALPPMGSPDARSAVSRTRAVTAVAVLALAVGAVAIVAMIRGETDPTIRSIAVLPFENLSGDSTQEYLADGLTDALITELARIPGIDVISRTSIGRFKRAKQSLPDIARELNVDGIVEGTILRDDGRIRINAQLVHGLSDRHLWGERFERPLHDLLTLEREIAVAIAKEISVATARTAVSTRASARPVDSLAVELYYRGRQAWRSRNPAGIRQSILLYKGALARDPSFAEAHAGLADAYRFFGGLSYGPADAFRDSARTSATRAIALDNTLSEAHATLGALLTDAAAWQSARREFELAIALSPSNALAHHWYATMLASLGEKADALMMIRRAKQLDPYSAPLDGALNQIETWAGVPPAERTSSGRRDQLDPTNAIARLEYALRLAAQRKCAEAGAEMEEVRALATSPVVGVGQAGVHWYCGDSARARATLAEVERRPDAARNTIYIAMAHTMMGQADSAFAWLDREQAWGMVDRFELRISPRLAPLRSDPRYPLLLRRVGLQ